MSGRESRHITRAGRLERHRQRRSQNALHGADDVEQTDRCARADVHGVPRQRRRRRRREKIGTNDVRNGREIPRLFTITKDGRRSTICKRICKRGNRGGVRRRRILARAEDVEIPQTSTSPIRSTPPRIGADVPRRSSMPRTANAHRWDHLPCSATKVHRRTPLRMRRTPVAGPPRVARHQ